MLSDHPHVVHLIPPGRFPTAVYDPGAWWNDVRIQQASSWISASAAWWQLVCSARVARLVLGRWHWRGAALKSSGGRAASALQALRCSSTYVSLNRYLEAASAIGEHISRFNSVQHDLLISLEAGPSVRRLNYHDSRSLVN